MRQRIDLTVAYAAQKLREGGAAGDLRAHHDGVEEHADLLLEAFVPAVLQRHTDAEVALATVAVEQHLYSREGHHVDRGPVRSRHAAQAFAELVVQPALGVMAGVRRVALPLPVVR